MLVLDTAHTPAHIGTVDIFDAGPDGWDYERLLGLIRERISYVPRYRQRIRGVPARLAGPVWVDDENFDLTYHVRRSALPRPGTMEQLREFVGRVISRRLDRSRPLWEMYVVEGLEPHRFALVTKSHLSLVDGIDTVEIGQVLFDNDLLGEGSSEANQAWHPAPEPTDVELVVGALWESAQDPVQAVQNVRGVLTGALGVAVAVGEVVGGVGGALGELAGDALRGGRPRARTAVNGPVSEQRRVETLSIPLGDLKAIRDEHHHTVNDVILAVLTGALRAWLLTRGESVSPSSGLIALVPMSVTEDDGEPTSLGSQVAPHLQALPIGEPSALMRLHQVAYGTQAHKDTGRAVGARTLSDIAGFAPTTLHALGMRVSSDVMRRQHDIVITNVPGPQQPVYAAGRGAGGQLPGAPAGARSPARDRGHVVPRGGLRRSDRRPGCVERPRRSRQLRPRRGRGAARHDCAAGRVPAADPQGLRRREAGRGEEGGRTRRRGTPGRRPAAGGRAPSRQSRGRAADRRPTGCQGRRDAAPRAGEEDRDGEEDDDGEEDGGEEDTRRRRRRGEEDTPAAKKTTTAKKTDSEKGACGEEGVRRATHRESSGLPAHRRRAGHRPARAAARAVPWLGFTVSAGLRESARRRDRAPQATKNASTQP